MSRNFHPAGLRNIFREMLNTAESDGNALVGEFLADPFCIQVCELLDVDYRQYRRSTRENTRILEMQKRRPQIKAAEPVSVDNDGQLFLF